MYYIDFEKTDCSPNLGDNIFHNTEKEKGKLSANLKTETTNSVISYQQVS